MRNFSEGARVVRVLGSWKGMEAGDTATVVSCINGSLRLREYAGTHDASKFAAGLPVHERTTDTQPTAEVDTNGTDPHTPGAKLDNLELVPSAEKADAEFRETTFGPLGGNGPNTETSKASNPKQAFGDLKAQLALVPDTLAYAAAPAFFEGASKYGAYNWRAAGVRASTYKAACERHLKKWFNGEMCDPKTGVPHLSSAIACLAIIVDTQVAGKLEDDRPPVIDLLGMEDSVAAVQTSVREQHKDKSPKHWTAKDMK